MTRVGRATGTGRAKIVLDVLRSVDYNLLMSPRTTPATSSALTITTELDRVGADGPEDHRSAERLEENHAARALAQDLARVSPVELGRLARKLPDEVREALRHWPEGRPWQGATVGRRSGYRVAGAGGSKVFLPGRAAAAGVRAGVLEERLLWVCRTELGEAVAAWLAGS